MHEFPMFLRHIFRMLVVTWLVCTGAAAEERSVAFIPKGSTHAFWREMARGAEDAARSLGMHMEWRGPKNEDGINAQSGIMGIYIRSKFDGLLLAPNSTDELLATIGKATAAGMRVIIVDSPLADAGKLPYVGTNNRKAGEMAARQVARDHPKAAKVMVLRYSPKHGSTTEREEGFIQALRKLLPRARIDDSQYSGITVREAEIRLGQILAQSGDIDILFTPNESGTEGASSVLQAQDPAGRIKHYGFDYSLRIHEALQAGAIQAVVIQDPYLMGRKAMYLMHDALSGKSVPAVFETPAVVVNRGNIEAPEVRAKTDPFLNLPRR